MDVLEGPGAPGARVVEIELPAHRETLASLQAGDAVTLSGPVFTARDATHALILAELHASGGVLPYGLEGQTLFYAGPTPPAAGRPAGAVGPTTSKRMDAATPELLEAGIVATIGKGPRSARVAEACARHGAVYFTAVGGAAALLATHVRSAEVIAYSELGPEALVRLELASFPAFVAIDSTGAELFGSAASQWRAEVASIDGTRGGF